MNFLNGAGFLEKKGRGLYAPSDWAIEFVKLINWSSEDEAWAIVAENVGDTWFVKQTIAAFTVSTSMTEDQLVQTLGRAAELTKRDEITVKSIKILIEFIQSMKFIIKDQSGNYNLNPNQRTEQQSKKIEVSEETELVQVVLNGNTYGVEVTAFKEFVKSKGKILSKKHSLT